MASIFLVRGSTGTGDTYCEWFVRAFQDRQQAAIYLKRAQLKADSVVAAVAREARMATNFQGRNIYDPGMQVYKMVEYDLVEVPYGPLGK